MNDSKSQRLQPVARHAASLEQEAALALGASQRELDARRLRLQELLNYRDEYARRMHERGRSGVGAATLQEYRNFLGRITTAIEQQQQLVAAAERECERRRQAWCQRHTRTEALGKVIDAHRSEEHRRDGRKEQKENDERAGRRREPH